MVQACNSSVLRGLPFLFYTGDLAGTYIFVVDQCPLGSLKGDLYLVTIYIFHLAPTNAWGCLLHFLTTTPLLVSTVGRAGGVHVLRSFDSIAALAPLVEGADVQDVLVAGADNIAAERSTNLGAFVPSSAHDSQLGSPANQKILLGHGFARLITSTGNERASLKPRVGQTCNSRFIRPEPFLLDTGDLAGTLLFAADDYPFRPLKADLYFLIIYNSHLAPINRLRCMLYFQIMMLNFISIIHKASLVVVHYFSLVRVKVDDSR